VALTVVMAAAGYPGTPKKGGDRRTGASRGRWRRVFHAGTALNADGALVANGGRVLNVTARGLRCARRAMPPMRRWIVVFPDGFCRRDIGWREIAREIERQSGEGNGQG
jgi:phosphoribosylamine--glycine ligase